MERIVGERNKKKVLTKEGYSVTPLDTNNRNGGNET